MEATDMVNARDVAIYFLQKDKTGELFDTKRVSKNGRNFLAGNARLNKYLHLAQNIYYAKNDELLFQDNIYAYDNGGVVKNIQENYYELLAEKKDATVNLPNSTRVFLDKLYFVLQGADLDSLIELSHEDPAWKAKHMYFDLKDQIMDTKSLLYEYKSRYEDVIELMERLPI